MFVVDGRSAVIAEGFLLCGVSQLVSLEVAAVGEKKQRGEENEAQSSSSHY